MTGTIAQSAIRQLAPVPLWAQAGEIEHAVILSTRVRIARNLSGEKFPAKMDTESRVRMVRRIADTIRLLGIESEGVLFSLPTLSELEIAYLVERRAISPRLARMEGPRAAFVWKDRDRSLMICEEDHLRLCEILPGLKPRQVYENILPVMDGFQRLLPFVKSETLGYLAACPANLGAAVRTSLFCHLPGLMMTKGIQDLASSAADAGFTIRGFWGEGSDVLGNTFQFTDGPGLSHRVSEMLTRIESIGQEIMEREALARIDLQTQNNYLLKDRISRALGILRSCRQLQDGETLALLSAVRLGVDIGWVSGIDREAISLLTFKLGRARLEWSGLTDRDSDRRNEIRAERAREAFTNAEFIA